MKEESIAAASEQSLSITRHISAGISFAAKVFAIGVPVLYALGRVYAEGYWAKIGLSAALMNYSVEDYLYLGFVAIFNAIVRLVAWLPMGPIGTTLMVVVIAALLSVVLLVIRRWLIPTLRARIDLAAQRISAWKADEDGLAIQFFRPFAALGLGAYTLLFYFFLTFLCMAIPIVGAYKAGSYSAEKARKRLEGVGPVTFLDARALVHLKGEPNKQVGVLLECSTSWCIVLRRGDFVAVRQEACRVSTIVRRPALCRMECSSAIARAKFVRNLRARVSDSMR